MTNPFLSLLKNRRTYYGICSKSPISAEQIQTIIEETLYHTPSAFNSQSSRATLLLGIHHKRLWDIVEETLRKMVPPENFEPTEKKIDSFRSGHGTILFFEEQKAVEALQAQFPLYKDKMPIFSEHASAMVQLATWIALESEGFGASLQHYNPLINEAVQKEWNLPESWELVAQMPFGVPTAEPNEKEFLPIDQRLKVFK